MFLLFSCIPDNKDFHSKAHDANQPSLYFVLQVSGNEVRIIFLEEPLISIEHQRLLCPPVATYSLCARGLTSSLSDVNKVLVRGDSTGQIIVWNMPEVAGEQLTKILKDKSAPSLVHHPDLIYSLKTAWETMVPTPSGIFDQLVGHDIS